MLPASDQHKRTEKTWRRPFWKQPVDRIHWCCNDQHGDYDADGITASALLIRQFRRLGIRCECVIPDRLKDGYGLSANSMARILEKKPSLVITVDCGITSVKEIAQLNEQGIEVIVTDHHE